MKNKSHYLYIIHFHKKYFHAQHYIGISYDTDARYKDHLEGKGAKLMKAVVEANVGTTKYILAKFPNYTTAKLFEKNLKKQRNSKRYCPCCAVPRKVLK